MRRFRRCNNLSVFILALVFYVPTGQAIAQNADTAFNTAVSSYNARQFTTAISGFRSFLATYPNDTRWVEATYDLADSYLETGDFVNAGLNYQKVMAAGAENPFANKAAFRIGEIQYLNGNYSMARQLLVNYLKTYQGDPNLVFVLYYLGNIGLAQNAPAEAEYYFNKQLEFDDWVSGPTKGMRRNETLLGLAVAKNRLTHYAEADALFRQIALDPSNSLAGDAYGRWGLAQYDRHAFAEAAATLDNFLRLYPQNELRTLAQETLAKCYVEQRNYQLALAVVRGMSPPTDTGRLLEVRSLFGMKQTEEGRQLLQRLDRELGPPYRDRINALKVNLAYDQRNWPELISIATSLLQAKYDPQAKRMTFGYYDTSAVAGVEKFPQDSFLKLCGALALAYAESGDTDRAYATYTAMNLQSRDGDPVLSEIVQMISTRLNEIMPNIGTGGGGDANQLRTAQEKYNARDYTGATTILENLLGVQYGVYDKKMTITYTPYVPGIGGASTNAKLSKDEMLDACQLLVLGYAYARETERSQAAMAELERLCKDGNEWQQRLVARTRSQIYRMPRTPSGERPLDHSTADGRNRGGSWGQPEDGTPGRATVPSDRMPPRRSTDRNDSTGTEQQLQIIADCRNLYKSRQYSEVETKLQSLLMQDPPPSSAIMAEAAILRGRALVELHRDADAINMGKLALEKEPTGKFAADALWMIVRAYVLQENVSAAVPYFERLVQEHTRDTHLDEALYYLAVDELDNGDARGTARAMTRLKKVYRDYPDGEYWSHATWRLALEAYKKQDAELAESYIQKLLRHPPDESILDRALLLKGQIAMERQQVKTALLAFSSVPRNSPLRDIAERGAQAAQWEIAKEKERGDEKTESR